MCSNYDILLVQNVMVMKFAVIMIDILLVQNVMVMKFAEIMIYYLYKM